MNINIISALKLKIAVIAACMSVAFAGAAMDVVTLTNGTVLRGEIYQRDNDGSLMMNLTNGNKRYVMPDEIASTSNDGLPFKYEKGSGRYTGASDYNPIGLTVYAAYDYLMPTKVSFGKSFKAKIGNTSAFSLGCAYKLNIKKGLSFLPGIELSFIRAWGNNDNIIETQRHAGHWGWLTASIPLQIGYDFKIKDITLRTYTGPVLECFIAEKRYGNLETDEVSSLVVSHNGEGYFTYNRVNLDWRIGIRAEIDRFSIGVAYTIGITNRVKDAMAYTRVDNGNYYDSYETTEGKGKMRLNTLQISVGVNL